MTKLFLWSAKQLGKFSPHLPLLFAVAVIALGAVHVFRYLTHRPIHPAEPYVGLAAAFAGWVLVVNRPGDA